MSRSLMADHLVESGVWLVPVTLDPFDAPGGMTVVVGGRLDGLAPWCPACRALVGAVIPHTGGLTDLFAAAPPVAVRLLAAQDRLAAAHRTECPAVQAA
jgi:thiol-disulfide isomerase/thioredoxin